MSNLEAKVLLLKRSMEADSPSMCLCVCEMDLKRPTGMSNLVRTMILCTLHGNLLTQFSHTCPFYLFILSPNVFP